jgi:hypothetical protein
MKTASHTLIEDLAERTRQNKAAAEEMVKLPPELLNWKSNPERWSILECIEHLNMYGDFYLPEIEQRIEHSPYKASAYYSAGLLGNYFANSMLPKEKLNKMKTFKDKNPAGSQLDSSTLHRFIEQQQKILSLLDKARQVDLTKTKTSISITNLIKLRLGDTFRVVVYHNQRHIKQAHTAIALYNQTQKAATV